MDYDDKILYIFPVFVSDVGDNKTPFNVAVYVENIPFRPPVWTRVFSSQRIDEKTNQTFEILATDGDRSINTKICYKIEFEEGKNCKNLFKKFCL